MRQRQTPRLLSRFAALGRDALLSAATLAVLATALPAAAQERLYHDDIYDGPVTQPVVKDTNPYIVYFNPDLYVYGGVEELVPHLQDHAPSANTALADPLAWKWTGNVLGTECDAVCGQRSCGIMGAKASYAVPYYIAQMTSTGSSGDLMHCPSYPGTAALAAYSAAWAFAWSMQEGNPVSDSEAMLMAMTADAFALLALSQEYGYDAQLAQTVMYARTLTPFYRGSSYASAPVIAAASQAASGFPRTTFRYKVRTGNDDDDWTIRSRPTEYTDLVGHLQAPDFYEGRTIKSIFSTDDWRRPRQYSDEQLMAQARSLAQPLVWTDAEIADAENVLSTGNLRLILTEAETLPSDWILRLQRTQPLPPRLEAMGNDLAATFAACQPN